MLEVVVVAMCGRFGLFADPDTLADRLDVSVPSGYRSRFNVAPGDRVLAVGPDSARLASWSAEQFNVRVETAAGTAIAPRTIPTSGFYEWRADGQPVRVSRPGDPILALAGLAVEDGVAILTTEARGPLESIHDRMPVTLARDREPEWIATSGRRLDATDSLVSHPDLDVQIDPVDRRLGDPTIDDPSLLDGPDHRQSNLFAFEDGE